jgi:membrane-associated phospholipid phosphatase
VIPRPTLTAILRAIIDRRFLVIMLLSFSVVMLSLLWSAGEVVDRWLFLLFNIKGYRSAWLDWLMWTLTQIGNMVTALLLAGIVYLFYFHLIAFEIVLGMISLWMVVESIKLLTERSRPYVLLLESRVVGRHEKGLSFPSGHTSQTFFLMTLLVQVFRLGPWGAFLLYVLAFGVGFTRMYVGAHYPRDVLGGALLGTVWGILTSMLHFHLIGIHP